MGKVKSKKDHKRDGERYVALPHVVIRSPGWRALNHAARSLLIDIAGQYTGRNNGKLVASRKVLGPLGWTSADTLHRAVEELLAHGLLVETRKGRFPATPRWLALTWYSLDWDEAMDVGKAFHYRGAYLAGGAPSHGDALVPIIGSAPRGVVPMAGQSAPPLGPTIGTTRGKTTSP